MKHFTVMLHLLPSVFYEMNMGNFVPTFARRGKLFIHPMRDAETEIER